MSKWLCVLHRCGVVKRHSLAVVLPQFLEFYHINGLERGFLPTALFEWGGGGVNCSAFVCTTLYGKRKVHQLTNVFILSFGRPFMKLKLFAALTSLVASNFSSQSWQYLTSGIILTQVLLLLQSLQFIDQQLRFCVKSLTTLFRVNYHREEQKCSVQVLC